MVPVRERSALLLSLVSLVKKKIVDAVQGLGNAIQRKRKGRQHSINLMYLVHLHGPIDNHTTVFVAAFPCLPLLEKSDITVREALHDTDHTVSLCCFSRKLLQVMSYRGERGVGCCYSQGNNLKINK